MFTKPKRRIDRVFIHCSASDNPIHDDISVIRDWHVNDNKWSDVGYHYFIQANGNIQAGRDIEVVPAAQKGNNAHTIAICLHGLSHFTMDQLLSLKALCADIHQQLPQVSFHGHCEVAPKTCPNFDYKQVLSLGEGGVWHSTH